ncbi:MAG: hypothetical protein ABL888_18475, partial [Pirellulaceae bacterium]
TTRFDRVSSGLTSANLILGLFVIAMLLMWMSSGEKRFNNSPPPILFVPTPAMADEEAETELTPLAEAISGDDLPEVNRPDSALALQQVTQAISSVRARIGVQFGLGENHDRPGPRRPQIKPPGGGPAKHWQIQFDELSQDEYYRMLEQLGARLFVVRKSTNEIVIVTCQENPQATISNRRELNDQFYFVHETTGMQSWDRQLATNAKVNVDDSFFAINFPPQVLAKLGELERLEAEVYGQTLATIRQSIFKACKTESGFDFAIDSQVVTRSK